MSFLTNFLGKPKDFLIAIGCVAVLFFFTGLWAGAKTAEPVIQERIVEKIVEVETIRLVEKIRVIVAKDVETKRETNRAWKTTISKDGTTVTEATEKVKEETKDHTKVERNKDRIVEVEKVVYKDRIVEKTTQILPDWRVGVQGGLGLSEISLTQPVITQPWILGVTGERRLIGSLYGGVWGNTEGAAGLTLSLGF